MLLPHLEPSARTGLGFPSWGQSVQPFCDRAPPCLACPALLLLPHALQDGPRGDPTIRKLFGLKLHKSLKAEEGEETIEVRCCLVSGCTGAASSR